MSSEQLEKKDVDVPYDGEAKVYNASIVSSDGKFASTSIAHRKFGGVFDLILPRKLLLMNTTHRRALPRQCRLLSSPAPPRIPGSA